MLYQYIHCTYKDTRDLYQRQIPETETIKIILQLAILPVQDRYPNIDTSIV